MTAKKDLKKRKSKKKVNKAKNTRNRNKKNLQTNVPLDVRVNTDKGLAMVSLLQTVIVMIASLLTFFANPKWRLGRSLIKQNKFLMDNLFTQPVLLFIGGVLTICSVYYIYMSYKKPELKKFFSLGALLLAIGVVYCVYDKVRTFNVYAFGVVAVFLAAMLQMAKLKEVARIEAGHPSSEKTE